MDVSFPARLLPCIWERPYGDSTFFRCVCVCVVIVALFYLCVVCTFAVCWAENVKTACHPLDIPGTKIRQEQTLATQAKAVVCVVARLVGLNCVCFYICTKKEEIKTLTASRLILNYTRYTLYLLYSLSLWLLSAIWMEGAREKQTHWAIWAHTHGWFESVFVDWIGFTVHM